MRISAGLTVGFCLLIAGCNDSTPPTTAGTQTSLGFLQTSNDTMVDGQGREVLLRGLNHIALRSDRNHPSYRVDGVITPDADLFQLQDLDDADFEAIAATGLNALRLVVTWEFAQPDPPPAPYNEAYFRRIDDFIARAKAHGLYVIFDFGQFGWGRSLGGNAGAPDWTVSDTCAGLPRGPAGLPPQASVAIGCAFMEFWENQPVAGLGLQDHYIALWKYVASRYRNEPAIAAYDLFNEPYGGLIVPGVLEPMFLYPFYRKLAAAIREVEKGDSSWAKDKNGIPRSARNDNVGHIVAFQPELYHSIGVPTPFALPIQIPNSIYMPHEYTVAYFAQRVTPAYLPTQDLVTLAYLQLADGESQGFGTPWMIGETGWTRSTSADGVGGPIPMTDVKAPRAFARDFTARADALRLGWLWFAWSSIDEAYGVNYSATGDDALDEPLMRELSRPYPRVTAGHVVSFSFNPDSGEYMQSTSGQFDAWSEIALPLDRQYPEGVCVVGDGKFLGRVAPEGRVTALSGSRAMEFDALRATLRIKPLPATLWFHRGTDCS